MTDTPSLDPAALRACPFCGGEPELRINGTSGYKVAYVRCSDCAALSDTIVKPANSGRDPEPVAVAAWNTRASDPSLLLRLEEAEAALSASQAREAGLREEGQAEGFAAAIAQLRGMPATKPPATLHHAAAILAGRLEQSRIPGAALSKGGAE